MLKLKLNRLVTLSAAAIISVTLAACGSADAPSNVPRSSDPQSEGPAASAQFNEADVAFAQEMIVHHQGAIEMSQLALERAVTPEVQVLASRIEAAQAPEIEAMNAWLESWGEPSSADMPEMPGMDHSMGDSMGMSEEEMAALEATSGVEFDRMFLQMMIEHHNGAIEMAEVEQVDGSYSEAITLAESIITSQGAEVGEMKDLLAGLPS